MSVATDGHNQHRLPGGEAVRSMVALAHKRSAAESIAHPDVQGAFGDSFLSTSADRANDLETGMATAEAASVGAAAGRRVPVPVSEVGLLIRGTEPTTEPAGGSWDCSDRGSLGRQAQTSWSKVPWWWSYRQTPPWERRHSELRRAGRPHGSET